MSKGNRVKTIGKELFVWAILFASAYFLAEQLTSWFMTTSLGRFVLNINDDFGWVVLIVVGLWTLFSLMGAYAQYSKPLFIVGISVLLINYYGAIEVSPEIYLSYYVLLAPYLIRQIDIKVARLRHKGFLEQISLWIENLLEKCDSYWKKHTNLSFFKYDRFDADDKLHVGREQMVKTIVDQVRKLKHDDSSFTIGLEGGWGSGKTTLLNKIKSELIGTTDEHGMIVEVVEFSPWAYPDGKSLSVEFLYELRDVLSKHSFRARFVINAYINALAEKSTNLVQLFTSLFFPRESLQNVKAKLSDLLRFHRVKLVVIIDDLDRLDADEMAEVFKMLRNTGDLPNAVYLVAYSKNHVEALFAGKKVKGDNSIGTGYLEKVINVELDINTINKESYWIEVQKEIETILYDSSLFKEDNPDGVNNEKIYHDFFKYAADSNIQTVRKSNLLINSIKARIAQLEKFEDLRFTMSKNLLILLELIKIEDYSFYCEIKSGKAFKTGNTLELSGKTANNHYKTLFIKVTNGIKETEESKMPAASVGRGVINRQSIAIYFLQEEKLLRWIRDIRSCVDGDNDFASCYENVKADTDEFMKLAMIVILSILSENKPEDIIKTSKLIADVFEYLDFYQDPIFISSVKSFVGINGVSSGPLFHELDKKRIASKHEDQYDKLFNDCFEQLCEKTETKEAIEIVGIPLFADLQKMQEKRSEQLKISNL